MKFKIRTNIIFVFFSEIKIIKYLCSIEISLSLNILLFKYTKTKFLFDNFSMRINIIYLNFRLFKYDSNQYSSFVFETIKLFKNKFRNNLKCKQSL
jgi:hypothetical protein